MGIIVEKISDMDPVMPIMTVKLLQCLLPCYYGKHIIFPKIIRNIDSVVKTSEQTVAFD